MLTDKEIERNRRRIVELLRSTLRLGMEKVLAYLEKSGFYEAPSSRERHHNWRGGLAQHSLGVCEIALVAARELPVDSVIICALLHDVCKARMLYYGADGKIHHNRITFKGHGLRSVYLLSQCGLELTEEERRAIRWHMGGHFAPADQKPEVQHTRQSPLWRAIYTADRKNATANN